MKTETKQFPTQIGQSITCDFQENTWTFEMPKKFAFTGGKFAIVPTEDYEKSKAEIVMKIILSFIGGCIFWYLVFNCNHSDQLKELQIRCHFLEGYKDAYMNHIDLCDTLHEKCFKIK